MKKFRLLVISILSLSTLYGQNVKDALHFGQGELQGTARFRALSGAFGALGGDMSAVSINPASSAVFSQSHTSFSLTNTDTRNATQYFNGLGSTKESNLDINQIGAVFVFATSNNSPWKKFSVGMAYERTNSFNDSWFAFGTNTDNDPNFSNSIASYFYDAANGKSLFEISALPGETYNEAYRNIGNEFGFSHQQAFLGFESFILEPDNINDDLNTSYTSNIFPGNFDHDYTYVSSGYSGKSTLNLATQYKEDLYLGLNINYHFMDFQRSTLLFEDNTNLGSTITNVEFENNQSTIGHGFSFQLGGIYKLTKAFRVGLTYDSPSWYTISTETTQYLLTNGNSVSAEINLDLPYINPRYKLTTPAKLAGSLAYVFGRKGLVSFDYSTKDYSAMRLRANYDVSPINDNINNSFTNAATYRVGGEYKVKQFSFRGGYRFEESPYRDGFTVGDLEGYSLGLGYNFGNTKLDITYDKAKQAFVNEFYNLEFDNAPAATLNRKNSSLTLSLSFNI